MADRVEVVTGEGIISGDLQESGDVSISDRKPTYIEGSVTYGGTIGTESGEIVDYADEEIRRGGSHDYLGRGYAQTQDRLERAVGDILRNRFRNF